MGIDQEDVTGPNVTHSLRVNITGGEFSLSVLQKEHIAKDNSV
jgi:hypothetical protein